MDKKVERLILKEGDVLVVKVPVNLFSHKNAMRSFYTQIRKSLMPRKNKILVIPDNIDISVIGEEEIKEYITNIDLWELWEGEEDV